MPPERIVNWDYGRPDAFAEMLCEFDLLVAARHGSYEPPGELAHAIRTLAVGKCDEVSASEVRKRIVSGDRWEHLVPAPIQDQAARVFAPKHKPRPL